MSGVEGSAASAEDDRSSAVMRRVRAISADAGRAERRLFGCKEKARDGGER